MLNMNWETLHWVMCMLKISPNIMTLILTKWSSLIMEVIVIDVVSVFLEYSLIFETLKTLKILFLNEKQDLDVKILWNICWMLEGTFMLVMMVVWYPCTMHVHLVTWKWPCHCFDIMLMWMHAITGISHHYMKQQSKEKWKFA